MIEQDEKQDGTSTAKSRTCVLIVEDEPSAREACEIYLDRMGFGVSTASNADEALERAAEHNPDVLVCDWRLGNGPDGVYVARELQRLYGTFIVFVTAYPIDELREATEDLDVSKYLRKPMSLPVLAETIAGATG